MRRETSFLVFILSRSSVRISDLFTIVLVMPTILYSVIEPFAAKPCQSQLERLTGWVMKDDNKIDAVWVHELQEMWTQFGWMAQQSRRRSHQYTKTRRHVVTGQVVRQSF